MATVNIHDAKTHFSKLIQRALSGEEIIVARGDVPLIRLEPLPEARKKRRLIGNKGAVQWISPDFDDPVEDFEEFMQ